MLAGHATILRRLVATTIHEWSLKHSCCHLKLALQIEAIDLSTKGPGSADFKMRSHSTLLITFMHAHFLQQKESCAYTAFCGHGDKLKVMTAM